MAVPEVALQGWMTYSQPYSLLVFIRKCTCPDQLLVTCCNIALRLVAGHFDSCVDRTALA